MPPPLGGAEFEAAVNVAQALKAGTARDILAEYPNHGGVSVDAFLPRALAGLDDCWLEAICAFLQRVLIPRLVPLRMATVSIFFFPKPTGHRDI